MDRRMTAMSRIQPAPDRTADAALNTDSPAPAAAYSLARAQRPPRGGKQIYAILTTRDEIILPRLKPLPYLTQARLIKRAQNGDVDAWRTVWIHNARLAYSVLNRHKTRPDLMADALQHSQLAIARAIRGFDATRLLEFSTYAFAAMSRSVLRYRTLHGCAARVPAPVITGYMTFRSRVARARSRAEWFDAREWYLTRFPALYHRLLGLHALAEPCPLDDARTVPADAYPPDARLLGIDLAGDLGDALARLDPRQRYIIDHRYGLNDRPLRTLERIGDELSLTKERVRQIQTSAERAIRAHLTERGWDTGLVPLQSLS